MKARASECDTGFAAVAWSCTGPSGIWGSGGMRYTAWPAPEIQVWDSATHASRSCTACLHTLEDTAPDQIGQVKGPQAGLWLQPGTSCPDSCHPGT